MSACIQMLAELLYLAILNITVLGYMCGPRLDSKMEQRT